MQLQPVHADLSVSSASAYDTNPYPQHVQHGTTKASKKVKRHIKGEHDEGHNKDKDEHKDKDKNKDKDKQKDKDKRGDDNGPASTTTTTTTKPKRVRTGCLTCRERHLKCDEAMPHCKNCTKSNRQCKRGVRLNFIDTWDATPPTLVTAWGTADWKVDFRDESREIASEYCGGEQRYQPLVVEVEVEVEQHQHHHNHHHHHAATMDSAMAWDFSMQQNQNQNPQQQQQQQQQNHHHQHHQQHQNQHQHQQQQQQPRPQMAQPLPPIMSDYNPSPMTQHQPNMNNMYEQQQQQHHQHHQQKQEIDNPYQPPPPPPPSNSASTQHSHNTNNNVPRPNTSIASFSNINLDADLLLEQEQAKKEVLSNQDETLFMQVFVEEVGLWMDSMDPHKHFSRLLPFHSLSEPMLLNAFLACGARHLTLVNPVYDETKALDYYDTATRYLLRNLTDPARDTVICATTAVILNVYEIMSERALQRMNHIAGARALIKECGWNARAQGIGAACFWLNVGLEVLSCLHFNWQVAWDPDEWGVDMDFLREAPNGRGEEVWTQRMLYIVAKVCNFRATIPRGGGGGQQDELVRRQRCEEWMRLKGMCEEWNEGVPRTMHPMALLHPFQTRNKSAFPEVWLIKRTSIVARLFFHMAMLLLAQIHPYFPVGANTEMANLQELHSTTICGIVAHVKDRGVASVAIRSLHHAAECLVKREEQEEVITIFERINRETGWRIGFVYKDLKEKWGWTTTNTTTTTSTTTTMMGDDNAGGESGKQTHANAAKEMGMERQVSVVQIQQQQEQQQQQQRQQQRQMSLAGQPGWGGQQQQMSPPTPLRPATSHGGFQSQHPQQQQQHQHQHHHPPSRQSSHTPLQQQQQLQTSHQNTPSTPHQPAPHQQQHQQQGNLQPGRPPSGIPNPMYAKADFSLPQHPYQKYYVPAAAVGGGGGGGGQGQGQGGGGSLGGGLGGLNGGFGSAGGFGSTGGNSGIGNGNSGGLFYGMGGTGL